MNPDLALQRFSRPFARPLAAGTEIVRAREGVYLHYSDAIASPLAELSPLPGFSIENLDDASVELNLVLADKAQPKLPSVRFALSCVEMSKLITSTVFDNNPLEVNQLLSLAELSVNQAKEGSALGSNIRARVLKVKFPAIAEQVQTQLDTLKRLDTELPEHIKLRIDFNGNPLNFPIETLIKAVDPRRVDYLEDPAFSVEELERLKLPYSIAADDLFLPAKNRQRILENPDIKTIVLKPQQIGSYEDLENLVEQCQSSGKRVTLTSLLETEVGLRHCFLFAQRLRKKFELEPCGFLTLDLFESYEEIFEQMELGDAGLFVRLK